MAGGGGRAARLDASVRVGRGGLGGGELGHGGLLGVGLAPRLEDGGAVREEPRGLEARRHVRQLELDRLELCDRLVEGLAVLRVLGGALEGGRRDAERLPGRRRARRAGGGLGGPEGGGLAGG